MSYPITDPKKCVEIRSAIQAEEDCTTTVEVKDEECNRLLKREIVSETVEIDGITGWKYRIGYVYLYPLTCSNNAKKIEHQASPITIPEPEED